MSEPLGATVSCRYLARGRRSASDVDPDGSPVGISGNFAPDAVQVTAAIDVGPLRAPTAELVVSWFHLEGPTPLEPIFVHRIEVRPGDHAYSTGVSQGLLALGRYEIVASIDDVTRTASWMVAEQRQGRRQWVEG